MLVENFPRKILKGNGFAVVVGVSGVAIGATVVALVGTVVVVVFVRFLVSLSVCLFVCLFACLSGCLSHQHPSTNRRLNIGLPSIFWATSRT